MNNIISTNQFNPTGNRILNSSPPIVVDNPTVEPEKNNESLKKTLTGLKSSILGTLLVAKKLSANEEAQKTFSETFMRDISLGEAAIMLERYKEINKITNKAEFLQALFNEAKSNYGFGNGTLELRTFTDKNRPCRGGHVKKLQNEVYINDDLTREELFKVVHHELRHKLQEYMMLNEFGMIEYARHMDSHLSDMPDKKAESLVEWIKEQNPHYISQFGINEFNSDNVPEKYKDWALKCLNDMPIYEEWQKDSGKSENSKYFDNYLEVDALKIENKMKKIYHFLLR